MSFWNFSYRNTLPIYQQKKKKKKEKMPGEAMS